MTVIGADLGVLNHLIAALGLVEPNGTFRADWLSNPGDYLGRVLADSDQREALVDFVDAALGGDEASDDPDGLTWLPLISRHSPEVTVAAVLDDRPANHVGVGLGLVVSTADPVSTTRLHLPLFRTPKTGGSVPNPIALGEPGARIRLTTEVTVDSTPATPGEAHLGGIVLGLDVPTAAADQEPRFSLRLRALQLPGAAQPRDVTVSLDDADQLDNMALELVLGLVQAQAEALGGAGPLGALAGLLGLRSGAGVIPFPLEALATNGIAALADWLESLLADPAARSAWLGHLAAFLGGEIAGDEVRLKAGPGWAYLGVAVRSGAGGHPVVVPTLSAVLVDGDRQLQFRAELVHLDLGARTATALPKISAEAVLRPDGGAPLLAGDPSVVGLRVGLALDSDRRPVMVLAADGVDIGTHHYDTLDLTDPDALAEAAGSVLGDVIDDLLGALGGLGTTLRVLLGLVPPVGDPAVPTLDPAAFLADPLRSIAGHWRTLVQDHAAAVPAVLTVLRDLVADASKAAVPVTGTGTGVDPWRLELIGPVALQAWVTESGDRVQLALTTRHVVDTIGQRCTRVETALSMGLVRFDLVTGATSFCTQVEARLTARARGTSSAVFKAGPFPLVADQVGLVGRWRAEDGFGVEVVAPNLRVVTDDIEVPLALPDLSGPAGAPLALDAAGWAAIEALAGFLLEAIPAPWLADVARALGWTADRDGTDSRLSLADLMADPPAALIGWLGRIAFEGTGQLRAVVEAVARLLTGTTGSYGRVTGAGLAHDPVLMHLAATGAAPALALWSGPPRLGDVIDPVPGQDPLTAWRPGARGLGAHDLARGIYSEARLGREVADLVRGRPDLAAGVARLFDRWTGSDGRIIPPASDPAGVTVHRMEGRTVSDFAPGAEIGPLLAGLLDPMPATTIHVVVLPAGAPLPWTAAPDRIVDLRAPGLAPEAFPLPAVGTGEWFVALGGRVDARLPTDDPDGVGGQAARLARILGAFGAPAGGLALIAHGGAGHAALRTAQSQPGVTAVVTLGTAFGPVAFEVLDEQPGADTLRLLRWLLPPLEEGGDDSDLARGRALVEALTSLLPADDPARELRLPVTPLGPPRAGLAVHAVFGVLTAEEVRRAVTAIVAAGLALRARSRAEAATADESAARWARLGVHVPITPAATGVTVGGWALVEMVGAEAGEGAVAVSTARAVHIHLEVGRAEGWLVGGPDPDRGPGPRPGHELRWLEADVHLPLGASGSGGAASAELILHEPHVFGIERERWVVRPAPGAAAAEVVTPALPEVRVLLSHAAEVLEAATDAASGALVDALRALGLLSPGGGTVPDAIDHLLHEPAVRVAATLADAGRRSQLAAAIIALLGDPPGVTVDVASGQVKLDLSGTPGDQGLVPWTAQISASGTGDVHLDVTLGSTGVTAAGGARMRVTAGPGPLAVTLDVYRSGATVPQAIPLWPAPDPIRLTRGVAELVPAELARTALEYLRSLDPGARPVLDALFGAIGLLGPPGPDGNRRVVLPAALLADPVGWLRHPSALGDGGGFSAARTIAFLDAFKPILGVGGGPGELLLAPGCSVLADSLDGNVRLGLRLDTGGFAPVPGASGRLVATGTFAVTLPPGVPPRLSLAASIGLDDGPPGTHAVHLQLDNGIRVFLRPATGPDLPLYPDPPGLGQLAQVATTQALPLILDAIAAETGSGPAGQAGAVVRAVGDLLNLRTGSPPHFDGGRLEAWASDPAGQLVSALMAVDPAALTAVSTAVASLLPPPATASVVAGELQLSAGVVDFAWRPAPFGITVSASFSDLPGVERAEVGIEVDASGVRSFLTEIGPAGLHAGPAVLRPYFGAAVGSAPAGGRRIEVGLARDAGANQAVASRWMLDGGISLVAVDGPTTSTDPGAVATALLATVLDLVAGIAISSDAVDDLLSTAVGTTTTRHLLGGVLLEDDPNPTELDANLFDPDRLLGRLLRLVMNLADANLTLAVDGGLTVGLARRGNDAVAVVGLTGRVPISTGGDVTVAIEADSRWITTHPPAGISVGLLRQAGAGPITLAPSLSANGVGIRLSRPSGPLLDEAVKLGSLAMHLFGSIDAGGAVSGGIHLELADLAVAVGGATGGNPVAQGILADAGQGSGPRMKPAFSPALAVQKQAGGPVLVSLSAGEGAGPWWLTIQKSFGPLYVEQVGFGVTVTQDQLDRIGLFFDGRVSIFGLTAAVDDLQLSYGVRSGADITDPGAWAVDLAGLAINADIAGATLAGGLRKFGDGANVEYIGMLAARFAVYGLSVFGGYSQTEANGQKFASFFAFGAVNAPIGGPPAFFLTGIGGGLGINRGLVFPTDLSTFGEFPFLKALDPGAQASPNPMDDLERYRSVFPARQGEFWFAAGISFTSFALVDGVAVVSVSVGNGVQIALLGLARMALPRPQFALVSIELGLVAHLSTREGVLWVQGQLTDNSWLLHESVRLTGGFAFVTWFAGPNKGQFVLTMGGYHPEFHRDGYPEVPRLGFRWSLGSNVVVKGGSYFALTSEAVMAGGSLEASAKFGPAWAHVEFRANGIVYFDPFWFQIDVRARISAGITIDVWIGEITISISIGAKVVVSGPEFHARATFEVGPVELTVELGERFQNTPSISWAAFVPKYLEEASPGVARAVSAIPGTGVLAPGVGTGGAEKGAADGSTAKPFEVLSEFEVTVVTTIPTKSLVISGTASTHMPSQQLGVAPMGTADAKTTLTLTLWDPAGVDWLAGLVCTPRVTGAFPVGVWGQPQPDDDRKVPAGEVITALEAVHFEATASIEGTIETQIAYNQVAIGDRKPLPFIHERKARIKLLQGAAALIDVLPAGQDDDAVYAASKPWLLLGGHGATAIAALEADRSAPPRFGSLAEGLAAEEMPHAVVKFPVAASLPPVDTRVLAPKAIAVLSGGIRPEGGARRTTVTDAPQGVRMAPPGLSDAVAAMDVAIAARLVRVPANAAVIGKSRGPLRPALIAHESVPFTRAAQGAAVAVGGRGAPPGARRRLDRISTALTRAEKRSSAGVLRAGEAVVLGLPNAARDLDDAAARPKLVVDGAPSRVVVLSAGGAVLIDGPGSADGTEIPSGAERLAVLVGAAGFEAPGLAGWHSGQELAYIGWTSALVPGGVVRAEGATVARTRNRFRAGWVQAAELVAGTTLVTTRFSGPVRTVVVLLDDPSGTDAGQGLALRLTGAVRPVGADGHPLAPTVVVAGNRSYLVYAVIPDPDGGAVTVAVASEDGWHLAGVLGSPEPVAAVVDRVGRRGPDHLLQPIVPATRGEARLSWREPPVKPEASVKKAPVKKAAVKKAAVKKAAVKKAAVKKAAVKKAAVKKAAAEKVPAKKPAAKKAPAKKTGGRKA